MTARLVDSEPGQWVRSNTSHGVRPGRERGDGTYTYVGKWEGREG